MKTVCAATWLALAPFAAAQAEEVTLKTNDGTLTLTGNLIDFNGSVFRIATLIGTLEIDAQAVTCEGAGCPEIDQKAEFAIAVGDGVSTSLLANLLEEYAFQEEMTAEQMIDATRNDRSQLQLLAGSEVMVDVSVESSDSAQALGKLGRGEAAIALTARPVNVREAAEFTAAGLADPSQPGQEFVVALDAIVPVVAPGNRLRSLTLLQMAQITSGQINNWSVLGGPSAPIRMVMPANDSSTFDVFNRLVLDPERARVSSVVERAASDEEVADIVARDPLAIGIVSAAARRNAEIVPVRRICGPLARPTPFSVKSEEYPLARRIFMYVSGATVPERVTDLIAFAGSSEAGDAIRSVGFVDQDITPAGIDEQGGRLAAALLNAPNVETLQQLKAFSTELVNARRLSTAFRFTTASSRLDNKALGDIDRMVEFLSRDEYSDQEILVVGFTDSIGRDDLNVLLSQQRAEQVRATLIEASAGRLSPNQFNVIAYGPLAPVGCNETAEGRAINRRVEIWVRDRT